jgi:hypothetical protein
VCIVVGAPPVLIDSTDAAASSWDVDDCMSVFLVQFRLKVTGLLYFWQWSG